MAAVTNLYRLVWGGRLFDAEQWSCSLHVDAPAGVNLAASVFDVPLSAWMSRADSHLSSAAHLDEVKFNQIAPSTGRYTLPTSNTFISAGAAGSDPPGAPQLSLVVSLRTALARGRGHAGRFYPPSGGFAIQSDGRAASSSASTSSSSAATLVNAINDLVTSGGGRVVVFSKVAQSVEEVTHVKVGRVIDTMRSRRTSLPEEPAQAAVS